MRGTPTATHCDPAAAAMRYRTADALKAIDVDATMRDLATAAVVGLDLTSQATAIASLRRAGGWTQLIVGAIADRFPSYCPKDFHGIVTDPNFYLACYFTARIEEIRNQAIRDHANW